MKVVRVGEPYDKDPSKIVHSAAFAGDIDLAHEKIIQYVFEKQREGLLIRKSNATQETRKPHGVQVDQGTQAARETREYQGVYEETQDTLEFQETQAIQEIQSNTA